MKSKYSYLITVNAISTLARQALFSVGVVISWCCYQVALELKLDQEPALTFGMLVLAGSIWLVFSRRPQAYQVQLSDEGYITVLDGTFERTSSLKGRASSSSYATSLFCVLKVSSPLARPHRYLIWRDSVDDSSFRRLCRVIRLRRRLI